MDALIGSFLSCTTCIFLERIPFHKMRKSLPCKVRQWACRYHVIFYELSVVAHEPQEGTHLSFRCQSGCLLYLFQGCQQRGQFSSADVVSKERYSLVALSRSGIQGTDYVNCHLLKRCRNNWHLDQRYLPGVSLRRGALADVA